MASPTLFESSNIGQAIRILRDKQTGIVDERAWSALKHAQEYLILRQQEITMETQRFDVKQSWAKRYTEIVGEAACQARKEAMLSAMAGSNEPMKLYWKPGALILTAKGQPTGYEDSGKSISLAMPLSDYYRWIDAQATLLPILG